MTFQLTLSPETEARLQHDEAARRGALTVASQAVEAFVLPSVLPKGTRSEAIKAARGSMRGILNSDEFLAQRHAEAADELKKGSDS